MWSTNQISVHRAHIHLYIYVYKWTQIVTRKGYACEGGRGRTNKILYVQATVAICELLITFICVEDWANRYIHIHIEVTVENSTNYD